MLVNCNEFLRVKLTDYGIAVLRENHNKLHEGVANPPPFTEPVVSGGGWAYMHLYDLMYEFGRVMYVGNPQVPFVDNAVDIPRKLC